jgi:hypothetical protein
MTWARLDDSFWMHPKVMISGNTAAGVFARCLSYCGCYLTDGLIPEPIAAQIAGSDKKALDALIDVGLLQRLESGGYYISDFLEYNRSKEETEAARRQRAEAGRKGGLKQKQKPELRAVNGNG